MLEENLGCSDSPFPIVPHWEEQETNEVHERRSGNDVVQLAGEGATTTGPNNQQLVTLFSWQEREQRQLAPIIGDGETGGAAVLNGMIYGVILKAGTPFACEIPVYINDQCTHSVACVVLRSLPNHT
ncbi:hypothetical protein CCH79_00018721 [Gambusia affinis]|uniref:Peptidase S1 domain-containing protein n=1 Tax=Gambusia affinis TaxID=33528 RepID=A0A315WAI7_GAMAF|nr:hypothetical protein CCH79_00018721 [Gambusia affinis]